MINFYIAILCTIHIFQAWYFSCYRYMRDAQLPQPPDGPERHVYVYAVVRWPRPRAHDGVLTGYDHGPVCNGVTVLLTAHVPTAQSHTHNPRRRSSELFSAGELLAVPPLALRALTLAERRTSLQGLEPPRPRSGPPVLLVLRLVLE